MNAWRTLSDLPLLRSLSIALLNFLWQGAVVATGYAAADIACRRRGAGSRARYALACAALAAMIALPAATFYRRAAAESESARGRTESLRSAQASPPPAMLAKGAAATAVVQPSSPLRAAADSLRPVLLAAWVAGVLALSLRLLAGWAGAVRLVRRESRAAGAEIAAGCARLARRLSVSRPVKILESAAVCVPTALGMFRPVILFPVSALTGLTPRQLEALLAHELAHVARHDYLVNLLQSASETLLFYHPAVWWISGRIRAERENCCDDIAVAVTGDARLYAGALVELEERRGDRGAGALALACVLLLGAAARVSTLGDAEDARSFYAEMAPASAAASPAVAEPARTLSPAVAPAAARPATVAARAKTQRVPVESGGQDAAKADAGEPVVASALPAPRAETRSSEQRLTPDELVAFRVHGVTPEFLREIEALGYTRARANDLLALRIHGVSAGDIAEFQKIFGRISLERCVSFRIHGVTPGWIRDLSAAGLPKISPDQAVSLRIHGVSPDFLQRFRDAGYRDLTADQAVAVRIHDVDPGDVAGWTSLGLPRPGIDGLVSARIHGVDPRFARDLAAEGLSGLDLEELTSLRVHGVTASMVKEMKSLGLAPLSADEVISLRVHGVTPELIREFQALGVAPLSAEDATSLRIHGVTPEFIRAFKALGYSRLSVDDVVSLRVHGVSPEEAAAMNRDAGTRLSPDDLIDARIEGRRRSK